MKKPFSIFFIILVIFLKTSLLIGNNITVSNISLTGQNNIDGYIMVQFDLNWENSWRTSSAPNNWDAAWVFVKYRIGSSGGWKHAKLNNTGHNSGTGTSNTIQVGLPYENGVFNATTNPAVGAFFYRSEDGVGSFNVSGTQLRWNYKLEGVADDAVVNIKVFAVEMVYVPEGSFYIGDGGTEVAAFYKYPTTTNPYLIDSELAITVGTNPNNLYYPSSTYGGDRGGPIPGTFPKGYAGFYCMKYELTQQQYVDYLNAFFSTPFDDDYQANLRKSTTSNYRHTGITGNIIGAFGSTNQNIPKNYMSWDDAAYFASWAGLRPMTELEFEKACKGPVFPVVHEYAWGTSESNQTKYTISNANGIDEIIASNYNTGGTQGNVVYGNTRPDAYLGPLRSGIFATATSNRVQSGASYYGIMELSGNLKEFTITVGNPEGRAFSHYHGDGSYSIPTTWPNDGSSLKGVGDRGGSWMSSFSFLRVSKRGTASNIIDSNYRYEYSGFRAVRSLPPI